MAEQNFTPDELKKEEWRDVPGYEGVYAVSSLGRVRREKGGRGGVAGKILKPRMDSWGYPRVVLYTNGETYQEAIHFLVMFAFSGPRPDGHQVNHKNCNKEDNRIGNLEYVTPGENVRHSFMFLDRKILYGTNNPAAKLTEGDVRKIRGLYKTGKFTYQELADKFKVSRPLINRILNRRLWKHI